MRALFGVVSLLVLLAVVGLMASRAMKASTQSLAGSSSRSASAPASIPTSAPTGTVRDQSRQIQDQVKNDIARALEQGSKRSEDADK